MEKVKNSRVLKQRDNLKKMVAFKYWESALWTIPDLILSAQSMELGLITESVSLGEDLKCKGHLSNTQNALVGA